MIGTERSRAEKPTAVRTARATPARMGSVLEWLALGSALLMLGTLVLRQLWPTDLGWQIAAGRVVLAGGPPRTDSLSFLAHGREWIELRWLWCVALATLYDRLGPAAVCWMSGALYFTSFAIALAIRLPVSRLGIAAAWLVAAALAASQRFVARPDAASALLFAAFLAILDRDRRRPGRLVAALVPLQILWVNTHTLFMFGPVLAWLAAFAAVGERTVFARVLSVTAAERPAARPGRAIVVALAVTLACLANPYGLSAFAFALQLAGELDAALVAAYAYELASPFAVRAGYTAVPWFVALAGASLVLALVRWRRLDLFLTLVWIATLALALSAIRNLLWFALAAFPFALHASPGAAERIWRGRGRTVAAAIAVAVAIGSLWNGWRVVTDRFFVDQHDTGRFGVGLTPHRYPDALARHASAWQTTAGRRLRLFSSQLESSWLLQAGLDSHVDPRFYLFTPAEIRTSLSLPRDLGGLEREAQRVDLDGVACSLEDPQSIERLRASPGWRLVAMDDVAALFARVDPARAGVTALNLDLAAAALRRALPTPIPADRLRPWHRATSITPHHRVGNALMACARPDLARPFLQDAVATEPRSTPAWLSLALAQDGLGLRADSRAARAAAVASAPDDPEALTALALQHLEERDVAAATPLLERAILRHPDHARSWALIGEARIAAGRPGDGAACFERAVALEPGNAFYRVRLTAARSLASTP